MTVGSRGAPRRPGNSQAQRAGPAGSVRLGATVPSSPHLPLHAEQLGDMCSLTYCCHKNKVGPFLGGLPPWILETEAQGAVLLIKVDSTDREGHHLAQKQEP